MKTSNTEYENGFEWFYAQIRLGKNPGEIKISGSASFALGAQDALFIYSEVD